VLSYIELFQGRLHDFIEQGMRRGSKYLLMIQIVFRAEDLPLDLAYVPPWKAHLPNALSRVKAKGVWQFMTGTAIENGLRRDRAHRRAVRPEKGHVAVPNTSARSVRSSTATGTCAGVLQRRTERLQRAIKSNRLDSFGSSRISPRRCRAKPVNTCR
jgi:membrane-bound lytic murein transglycosylase D